MHTNGRQQSGRTTETVSDSDFEFVEARISRYVYHGIYYIMFSYIKHLACVCVAEGGLTVILFFEKVNDRVH